MGLGLPPVAGASFSVTILFNEKAAEAVNVQYDLNESTLYVCLQLGMLSARLRAYCHVQAMHRPACSNWQDVEE